MGLGLTTVDVSGRKNVYYHVPIQITSMVLPLMCFFLRGGCLGA